MKNLTATLEIVPGFGVFITGERTKELHNDDRYSTFTLFIAMPFMLLTIEYNRD